METVPSYEVLKSKPSHIFRDKIGKLKGALQARHGISFFYFQRRYKGNVLLHIVTDFQWQFRYFSEYYGCDSFQTPESIEGKNYYLWDAEVASAKEMLMHQERTEIYKIPPGISFVRKSGIFEDTFSYSTNLVNNPIEHIIKIQPQLIIWEKLFLKEIDFILIEQSLTERKFSKKQTLLTGTVLNTKERNVVKLLASDLDTYEIAQKIFLSEKTVQKIIERSKEKLNCKTRACLVGRAMIQKII